MPRVVIEVTRRGGLWGSGPKDLRKGIRKGTEEITRKGKLRAGLELRPGHGLLTGAFKSNLQTEQMGLSGLLKSGDERPIKTWIETGRRRGKKTRFRGTGVFRKTKRHMETIKRAVMEKHLDGVVKKL